MISFWVWSGILRKESEPPIILARRGKDPRGSETICSWMSGRTTFGPGASPRLASVAETAARRTQRVGRGQFGHHAFHSPDYRPHYEAVEAAIDVPPGFVGWSVFGNSKASVPAMMLVARSRSSAEREARKTGMID